jgi:hypothetical protein
MRYYEYVIARHTDGTIRYFSIAKIESEGMAVREGESLPETIAGSGWTITHVFSEEVADLIDLLYELETLFGEGALLTKTIEEIVEGTIQAGKDP